MGPGERGELLQLPRHDQHVQDEALPGQLRQAGTEFLRYHDVRPIDETPLWPLVPAQRHSDAANAWRTAEGRENPRRIRPAQVEAADPCRGQPALSGDLVHPLDFGGRRRSRVRLHENRGEDARSFDILVIVGKQVVALKGGMVAERPGRSVRRQPQVRKMPKPPEMMMGVDDRPHGRASPRGNRPIDRSITLPRQRSAHTRAAFDRQTGLYIVLLKAMQDAGSREVETDHRPARTLRNP